MRTLQCALKVIDYNEHVIVFRRLKWKEADKRRRVRDKARKLGLEIPPIIPPVRRVRSDEEIEASKALRRIKNNSTSKAYRARHPERRAACLRANKVAHPEVAIASAKRCRPKVRARNKARAQTDVAFRIKNTMRGRISQAMRRWRGGRKIKYLSLVGCTMAELVAYLESKYTAGMTLENYGSWHIDHVRPCASFDLSDPEQVSICFHYTNLQPLWANDNIKKGARLDWRLEEEHAA